MVKMLPVGISLDGGASNSFLQEVNAATASSKINICFIIASSKINICFIMIVFCF